MMWNQAGTTYGPYRNAQRTANRLQPKDQQTVDPFAQNPQLNQYQPTPFQQPVGMKETSGKYKPNRGTGDPTSNPYRSPMRGNPLGDAIMGTNTAPPPAQTGVQNPGTWDTDGWATPKYLGRAAGGPMAGWDQKNWDDSNMQTPKYVVGRILSNYEPSEQGLTEAMKEISQAYPGASFDGKDKITIPGLGVIDVLVNAGGENKSWAWQDQTNVSGDPLTAAISTPTNPLMAGNTAQAQGNTDAISMFMQDPKWRDMLRSLGIKV